MMANLRFDTFSQGEKSTLISALMHFREEMSANNALGDDETGEGIRIGYLNHCIILLNEIAKLKKKT